LSDFRFHKDQTIKDFIADNRLTFEQQLLEESVDVHDKLEELKHVANLDLIEDACKLVNYIVQGNKQEVMEFGSQEGLLWAKQSTEKSYTLTFKIEWVQVIRKVLWNFFYKYDQLGNKLREREDFYHLERKTNLLIADYMKVFFVSYSNYKDDLLEQQKQLVDHLSVPIIPISSTTWILPLIGMIDERRANIMEEKILMEISSQHIETLIMDLSGIPWMDEPAVHRFIKIIDVINITGCRCIVTGLRPEIITAIVKLEPSFSNKVITKATLKHTLQGSSYL